MKKISLLLIIICISSSSCKKKTSCTCKDTTGKIVYNEVNETRSKLEKQHFETKCLEKESTYYTVGSGSVATTQTTVPCEIS